MKPEYPGSVEPKKGALESSRGPFHFANRLPFFYGWVMLPIAILAQAATSPGQTFGVSIFNPSLRQSLSISHAQLTGAYMLGTLLAALPQPFIGAQMDRYGIRRVMTIASISLGLACFFMSQVNALWTLFLAFFFLRLFGQGAMGLLASNIPAMWFHERLGRVSGLVNIGFSGSTALLPPVILALIYHVGWRWAYALLGFGVLALMLPVLTFLFHDRPEDVGQSVDGFQKPQSRTPDCTSQHKPSLDLRTAQRTPAFWIMLVLTALWALIVTGIFFNIIPIFTSQGLTESQATSTYSTLAVTTVALQLLSGPLADRVRLTWLLSLGVSFLIGALLILVNLSAPWMGQAYALLLGACQGVLGVVAGTLWARYYGRTHLGKIRGRVYSATVAGSSSGPFIMGLIYDRFGTYDVSLWLFIFLLLPLVVAVFWARQPAMEAIT